MFPLAVHRCRGGCCFFCEFGYFEGLGLGRGTENQLEKDGRVTVKIDGHGGVLGSTQDNLGYTCGAEFGGGEVGGRWIVIVLVFWFSRCVEVRTLRRDDPLQLHRARLP
jgi:hypothetical protein